MLKLHSGLNYPSCRGAFSVQERQLASHCFNVGHGSAIRPFLFLARDYVLGHCECGSDILQTDRSEDQGGGMKASRICNKAIREQYGPRVCY